MKLSPLGWIGQRIRRRIPALILLTVSCVGSALFGVAFALGTKGVINAAIGGDQADLIRAAMVQLGIICGMLLCLTLRRWLHAKLLADLDRDWKKWLSGRIFRGEYGAVSQFHSGELLNRLNNDVRLMDEGILEVVPGLASMVTRLVAVVAALLVMEPIFTVLLLGLGAVVAVITGAARRYLRELNKAVSASEGKVSGFFQEAFEKLLLVQAMNVEAEVARRGDERMEERYALQKKRWRLTVLSNTCVSLLGYGSGFAALVWCAFGLFQGTLTFGDLTAVTQLVSQLQGPFVNLSGIGPKYFAMTAACQRLMELEEKCRPAAAEKCDIAPEDIRAICAEDLCFSYGREPVLQGGSFRLEMGSFAVVTGPSGIGKSTLLKLLLGIYPPGSGKLVLETGSGLVPITPGSRHLFAYVPQGNLLLSGTVRENLLLTNPEATEEAIAQAVYISGMDSYLPQLPKGLETELGENALGLSEGQAQRLSIARAVLSGAPILLLDECTSALDSETEALVLQRLRTLGRTCIAVTHRPAMLEIADSRLEVDGGRIRAVTKE